jgi:repressor LexA
MQAYFKVSPPSVHQMVLTLERNRLIKRTPGGARSIRGLLARADLPDLE